MSGVFFKAYENQYKIGKTYTQDLKKSQTGLIGFDDTIKTKNSYTKHLKNFKLVTGQDQEEDVPPGLQDI